MSEEEIRQAVECGRGVMLRDFPKHLIKDQEVREVVGLLSAWSWLIT
jgi:hypothetical protein